MKTEHETQESMTDYLATLTPEQKREAVERAATLAKALIKQRMQATPKPDYAEALRGALDDVRQQALADAVRDSIHRTTPGGYYQRTRTPWAALGVAAFVLLAYIGLALIL